MHELVSYDSDIFLKLLIHLGMLRFITLFTVVSFVVFVGAVYWVGDILTKPSRVETGSPPTDLGGHTLTFRSGTGTILSGWFFPGISGRGAILLLHPIRSNKREMLPRARFLIHEGFSVLLVDLQAHGESSGERITFGYREAKDIEAATEKLKDLAQGEKIGAIGISLGAASLLFSGDHSSFSAIVLESLYSTIDEAITNRLQIYLGSPGSLLTPLFLSQLKWRLGISPDKLRPIDFVSQLRVPVLIIHGTEDNHTTLLEVEQLFAAIPEPKEFYRVHGAAHIDLHTYSGKEYEQRIVCFFAHYL
jgi:fermentation-respiration switch protein FrsA (DUF1100 family)